MNEEKRRFLREMLGLVGSIFLLLFSFTSNQNVLEKLKGSEDVILEIKDGGLVIKRPGE